MSIGMSRRLSATAIFVVGGWAITGSSCRQAPPAVAGLTGNTLRIVSWNVHACESGIDKIIAELIQLNADIVCLQEAMQGPGPGGQADQVRRIAGALGMHECFCASPMPDGRMQCVVILTRAPLANTTTLEIGPGRHYGVTGVVRWHGKPLRVVSVHLAGTYLLSWQHIARTCGERMREASDLAARVAEWGGSILLAGDFNVTPKTGVYERLAGTLVPAPLDGATFPSHEPVFQLDHVLLSRGLQATHAEVATSLVSDHRPVVVEISAAKP